MTIFICTCGTSAAKNLPREPRFDSRWVADKGGIDAAAEAVYESFRDYAIDDDDALCAKLSAEIHSLARMQISASDSVVLCSSETLDGQACADALKRYLVAMRPGVRCRMKVIEGLQVTDAQRFRTEGVLNFTKAVLAEIDANGASQCVLNPTGGFKSLVPYTVLIGMIKGVPAKYIFEQSAALIPLPILPVEFARERIEPIRPLMERIERDSAIPRADLDHAVPFHDRAFLEPLFEDLGNGQITMSPVGFLIRDELKRLSALVPYLSRRALDDLLRVRDIEGTKPEEFICRVAANPDQVERARHDTWSNGLFWLKRGHHTRDRYLASIEDWRLLIWRITDHYDGLDQKARKSDMGAHLAADRRAKYEPFVRMDLYEQR